MKEPLILYWSRRDFRLLDNRALSQALAESESRSVPFLPLFILEDYMTAGAPLSQFGYPSRWFLTNALPLFAQKFKQFACVQGKGAEYLIKLSEHFALEIFVNEDIYPDFYTQVEKLQNNGISVSVVSDALTISKDVRTQEGNVYSVFTPFKKRVWSSFVEKRVLQKADPLKAMNLSVDTFEAIPTRISVQELSTYFSPTRLFSVSEASIDIDTYHALPDLNDWYVNEDDALLRFGTYLKAGLLDAYKENRDSLEKDIQVEHFDQVTLTGKTSKMSVALTWGLVSPHTLVTMIQDHFGEPFDNLFSNRVSEGALTYIGELIWREFYRYLFFHKPELMHTEFQEKFRGTIAWLPHTEAMERFIAWIKGETGYPVVDAAMHQLARRGWMHNRARMVVASVLTKNLGVDWRWGQEYFRAMLIDLDEASNNGGWQWGASVGADPKPIRIFNPELQAKNYDASGAYRDTWLTSHESVLRPYLTPIVAHEIAREEARKRYGLSRDK